MQLEKIFGDLEGFKFCLDKPETTMAIGVYKILRFFEEKEKTGMLRWQHIAVEAMKLVQQQKTSFLPMHHPDSDISHYGKMWFSGYREVIKEE